MLGASPRQRALSGLVACGRRSTDRVLSFAQETAGQVSWNLTRFGRFYVMMDFIAVL